ncbi:MAG: restriction endonuclease [Gammaproteobacteria bacterium]|nr:restriction endonuclease [Gammaproteobacteria bacterium]MBU1556914.1 restriction endonuclease [Gammaproteobacteria bacterium]MBU2071221.1 restriction endonuclease [Gammaproteobacteria bacterium]MBU2182114.1 restriction endonuclease [Gammaproteobacteria bacterium]MBU2205385.1 restriction endonuclease [Gammaproteobacteria bacterium]
MSEQRTFPDLRNWEDSDQKIQDAHKAVQELKHYLREQDEEITSERDRAEAQQRAREEREKIQRSLTDKAKLQQELDAMHIKIGTQDGGYEFEDWFYRMLDYCEITNRRPYKTGGRQIDGSMTLDGTTYLVELKFQKDQAGAPDVDSLKAKVSKMADNTMGVMLTMSGYSSVAISDASGNKTTILLLEASHLYLFLSGSMGFDDILSRVRRHASQTGEAFLPVNKFSG